jgi:hypothetical protein
MSTFEIRRRQLLGTAYILAPLLVATGALLFILGIGVRPGGVTRASPCGA